MRVSGFLSVLAVPVVVASAFFALLSASFYGYSNLTDETRIAELSFAQVSEGEYVVNLSTGDFCEVRRFPVRGDQWRLDANFLKWKYWAAAIGMESQYRLDRLEGRYSDVNLQNSSPVMAHSLGEPTLLDLATFSEQLGPFNFLADAVYGSSTFQAIDETRIFDVYRTPTGIITREREHPGFDLTEDILSIEINHACGNEPGIWFNFSYWLNDTLLQWQE